jgi:hypothetical protein
MTTIHSIMKVFGLQIVGNNELIWLVAGAFIVNFNQSNSSKFDKYQSPTIEKLRRCSRIHMDLIINTQYKNACNSATTWLPRAQLR